MPSDPADVPILTSEIKSAISAIMARRGFEPDDYNLDRMAPSPCELQKAAIRREYREMRLSGVKVVAIERRLSQEYGYTAGYIHQMIKGNDR